MDYLPHVFVGAVFAYLVFRVIAKGGFKAALLGSSIVSTVGEIELATKGVSTDVLRVHKLKDGNVGIERTMKGVLGFSTATITLSPEQAQTLRGFLEPS